jgi:multiple sugar transport system ATP-binding protein
MSSVTLKNATKEFGSFTAVRDISLNIEDGEFVAFLGPSGCGKTTTMNMIAGLEGVSSGSIHFGDQDVTNVPVSKRGVGFVFQNYAVFTHMSVRKNLAFGLEIRKLPAAEIDKRVGQMAEFMALTHRLDQPSSSLSVNELQKLAIGRSAIVEPSIFLLDEPLSNLDAAFREKMREELRELQRSLRQTMVYVTHDQVEAMGLADRIAVMDKAKLQQFGTPDAIHDRPANVFVAKFIGTPGMNILHATLTSDGNSLMLGSSAADIVELSPKNAQIAATHGKKNVLFGFRAQGLSIVKRNTKGAISAEVALVETIGRRRIVHFVTGGAAFLGVFPRETSIKTGEGVSLLIDADRVLLFDAETEARLSMPGEDNV